MNCQWRKSSFSTDAEGSNCLELAASGSGILIRESDDPSVIIKAGPTTLRSLITAAKRGGFDQRA
ncbi:DUF397 domain-containing protein [Streptomyces sp. ISL-11]|nr:DUF397 domain-containing protein [Streptomyces sp. ISL-11]